MKNTTSPYGLLARNASLTGRKKERPFPFPEPKTFKLQPKILVLQSF